MRVKLGKRIYLCTCATHSPNSDLLLLHTNNGLYTVATGSISVAEKCYNKLFVDGYCDFSNFEYCN